MERVAPIIDSHPSTAAIKERGLTGRCERILRMDCHRAAKQNAVDRSLWIWRSQRSDPRRCLCQVKSITGSDAIRDWPVLTASSLFELAHVPGCRFRSPTECHYPAVSVGRQFFFGQVEVPTQGYERLERGPQQSICIDNDPNRLHLKTQPSIAWASGRSEGAQDCSIDSFMWEGAVKQRIRLLPPDRFRKHAMVVRARANNEQPAVTATAGGWHRQEAEMAKRRAKGANDLSSETGKFMPKKFYCKACQDNRTAAQRSRWSRRRRCQNPTIARMAAFNEFGSRGQASIRSH